MITSIKVFFNKNHASTVGEESTETRWLTSDIQHSTLLQPNSFWALSNACGLIMALVNVKACMWNNLDYTIIQYSTESEVEFQTCTVLYMYVGC